MLITILSILVIFIVALIIKKHDDDFGWGGVIGMSLAFGALVALALHLFTFPFAIEHKYKTFEHEIVASKADSRINGSFGSGIFYVKGKVDEVDYYFVLTKTNEIYRQEKTPVESTVIIETTGKPKVVMNKHYSGASAWSNWIRFHDEPEYRNEKDTIYVPVGTVSGQMNFDVF